MKLRKITALLLGLSLLLTGCGSSADNKSDTPKAAENSLSQEQTSAPMSTAPSSEYITEKTSETTVPETTAAQTTEKAVITSSAPQSTSENSNNDSSYQQDEPQQNYSQQEHEEYQPAVTAAPYVHTTKRTTVRITTARQTTATTTTTAVRMATPQDVLGSMSLNQKVCQMFMVTPEAITGISPMLEVGNGTKNAMNDYPVGGIIYFSQNLTSKSQIKAMISNTQGFSREA